MAWGIGTAKLQIRSPTLEEKKVRHPNHTTKEEAMFIIYFIINAVINILIITFTFLFSLSLACLHTHYVAIIAILV